MLAGLLLGLCIAVLWIWLAPAAQAGPVRQLSAATGPAASGPLPAASPLAQIAEGHFKRQPVGVMSVAVVRRGEVVWRGHYGSLDALRPSPPDDRSVYRVGSVTKQLTGLMLLQLVEARRVRLSDPVSHWAPEIDAIGGRSPIAAPVTLMQLANHTSGLPPESTDPTTYNAGSPALWESSLMKALAAARYQSEPGSRFAYGNLDYALLALALSRAAGRPYAEWIETRLTGPLGMSQTRFELSPDQRTRLVRGYVLSGEKLDPTVPDQELAGRGYKVASGGAFSTLEDLVRLVAWQTGHSEVTLLRPESRQALKDYPIISNSRLDGGYGIGFQVYPADGFTMQGHLGGVAGYRALTVFDPDSGVGVVALRNVTGDAVDLIGLARDLIRASR